MAEEAARTISYGPEADIKGVVGFLNREMQMNRDNFKEKRRRRTPCVWGAPGVGKTALIRQYEAEGYVVIPVPLAQFEEMGDLNGMPREAKDPKTGQLMTVTSPPEWVPTLERHGKKVILLLDDFNRADPRIIKGTMQLIQDYGLITWQLDQEDWHIIATANPEGGLNDVTPLDPAQVSRFSHITLAISGYDGARQWAAWATENKIDDRQISYILMNNGMLFTGRDRVNPRTWAQAADILRMIPNNGVQKTPSTEHTKQIAMHYEACLDKEAANAFTTWLSKGALELIEPEEILDNLEKQMPKLKSLGGDSGKSAGRVDCLFAIFERLYLYICSDSFVVPSKEEAKNVTDAVLIKRTINFFTLLSAEIGGRDMRWSLMRRLYYSSASKAVDKTRAMMAILKVHDKKISDRLIGMLAETVEDN